VPPQVSPEVNSKLVAPVTTAVEKSLSEDPRWDLVQRLAASAGFRKSPKIRAFLLYVCENSIKERLDGLTEQQIGIHVFSRSPGYNPSDDNVVRAQARILRWKLEEYFVEQGRTEPLIIIIPKGGYHPEFHLRPTVTPAAAPETVPQTTPETKPSRRTFSPAVLILSMLVMVLTLTCLWLAVTRREVRSFPAGSKAFAALWNGFLGDNQRTLIVIPDDTFALLQLATGPVPLQEIISGEYERRAKELSTKAGIEAILPGFTNTRRTFMTSATDVASIAHLWQSRSSHLDVRSAGDLRMNELNGGNAILIGAMTGNPWMRLFDQGLNFAIRWDRSKGEHYYLNRKPALGEQSEYHSFSAGSARTIFGGIAYLPSLDRRGNVLLIFGANEVAAAFITNEKLSSNLLDMLAARSGSARLPHFEALLKAKEIGGEPAATQVEAYRIVSDSAPAGGEESIGPHAGKPAVNTP
jgi:hypothetical protein